ncbi:hypothetical protein L1987_24144 [Smallanthus sonchifolius]|uniref:Uncharacterized protein n=1 Tax=Smallanthus sonchifolius TaxID=185202 RepID=A0ACB9IL26_9ASTR|nr:hypothetical protein L1987_24144 [Smallanthus sonchifolius]
MCGILLIFLKEEGLDYDDVFALVARIEAIRIFLAYASFMKFKVYQMDVKTVFLYGVVKEEVYVNQPPGFKDHDHLFQVYKLDKAFYGLHQAPRAWYETLSTHLTINGFVRGTIDKTLFLKKIDSDLLIVQVEQSDSRILIHQAKYVKDILTKFNMSDFKSASTPIAPHEPLTLDLSGVDVNQKMYRSCLQFVLVLDISLHQKSPMNQLDYGGCNLDRKSKCGGCQFLGERLISWQCKKQTNVSTSTSEAEYTAASSCWSQVIWIHHQLLDFGINLLESPIYCDNEAELGIVKNPIQHSKTKHIAIRRISKNASDKDFIRETVEVFRNKKDDRGIVVRNKARLVIQYQEEGLDYDDVFALVARIEAIRIFLAHASFMKFKVYQMDVKTVFLYGVVKEEVYVNQPPGFKDPDHLFQVYKLDKAFYGLHEAPRAWYETLSTHLTINGFVLGTIDKTLFLKKIDSDLLIVQVEQSDSRILIHQAKYVKDILTKFNMSDFKSASTPIAPHEPLTVDLSGVDVNQKMYRSMIGSFIYLTASRPDIMFAVCSCARYQSASKESHESAVKRIYRYLKGRVNRGLWYPSDSYFQFYAYTDSDYGGCNLNRKYKCGGCQFLGERLISWQCKKQTNVSTSTSEAEYTAASSCWSQVIWIQHQLLDFGINLLETPIYCDNEAKLGIVKNPIQHSKTKHIAISSFHLDCDVHIIWTESTVGGKKIKITEQVVREVLNFKDNVSFPYRISYTRVMQIIREMGYKGEFPRIQVTKTLLGKQWRIHDPELGVEDELNDIQGSEVEDNDGNDNDDEGGDDDEGGEEIVVEKENVDEPVKETERVQENESVETPEVPATATETPLKRKATESEKDVPSRPPPSKGIVIKEAEQKRLKTMAQRYSGKGKGKEVPGPVKQKAPKDYKLIYEEFINFATQETTNIIS